MKQPGPRALYADHFMYATDVKYGEQALGIAETRLTSTEDAANAVYHSSTASRTDDWRAQDRIRDARWNRDAKQQHLEVAKANFDENVRVAGEHFQNNADIYVHDAVAEAEARGIGINFKGAIARSVTVLPVISNN